LLNFSHPVFKLPLLGASVQERNADIKFIEEFHTNISPEANARLPGIRSVRYESFVASLVT
jgi:hypothetical protein